ncbi:hypothetical protein QO034_11905 [Sedimentitalea sp. JM2-8]|uniref:Uncharacterized protein n=1 Tax=Sedimentitalea xiamensis TaxID=3050037 RepID=A0ABT7FFR7_9RHOB|nr:hypothetical protein [Sedimentitalea xiamensis]MDK3073818.1 hypothetical protein [Sedimentitalea xiamensis]
MRISGSGGPRGAHDYRDFSERDDHKPAFLVKPMLLVSASGRAALDKLRLTTAMQDAAPVVARRLRRSFGVESVLTPAIPATTAALTTVTSSPSENTRIAAQQPKTVQLTAHASGDVPWRT